MSSGKRSPGGDSSGGAYNFPGSAVGHPARGRHDRARSNPAVSLSSAKTGRDWRDQRVRLAQPVSAIAIGSTHFQTGVSWAIIPGLPGSFHRSGNSQSPIISRGGGTDSARKHRRGRLTRSEEHTSE